MKIKIKFLAVLLIVLVFYACGESTVEIGQNTYSPKIVIEGYLYPGKKVENIRITRNIPLNTQPDPADVVLYNADVKLTDLQDSKEYTLVFNPGKYSFEYNGSDLQIDYNKSYKLTVKAAIDGQNLTASSVTTVPKTGFKILKDESFLDSMKYRETDNGGIVKQFKSPFTPSPETEYYAISIVALDASFDNFIYDNPYMEIDRKDLEDDFDIYKYQFKWLQNVNSYSSKIDYNVEWLDVWFFGRYRMIIYAADENYRLFAQTYKNVQEFDGNFHEPRINIQGDGIGIFGSMIADTVYFKVTK